LTPPSGRFSSNNRPICDRRNLQAPPNRLPPAACKDVRQTSWSVAASGRRRIVCRWRPARMYDRPPGLLGWAFRPRNFMKNPPRRINREQRANRRRGFSTLSPPAAPPNRLPLAACKSRMVGQPWRERLWWPSYVRPGAETPKGFKHPFGPLRRSTAAASVLRGRDDIAVLSALAAGLQPIAGA
jgi:hypothetical protein